MARFVAVFAALVLAVLPSTIRAGEVKIGDTIKAGIRTAPEHEAKVFGYRVIWINWDSDFRESDLRLGDKILGVDNYRYTRESYKHHDAIGDWAESGYWEKQGAKDGDLVALRVLRDGEEIDVPGELRANRFYFNDEGKQTMDVGGPERRSNEKDENGRPLFRFAWAGWYEEVVEKPGGYASTLDNGWERSSFDNRKELRRHLEQKERIDYLVEKYPCKFAETMARDWERVRAYLEGEVVELPADALDYRTRQEEVRKEVKEYAKNAAGAFEEELGDRFVESPSVSGGIEAQREAYVGKVLYFDGLGFRNIINDLEQTFLVAGSERNGFYFMNGNSPAMQGAFGAFYRYRSLVNPRLAERFSTYIEVLDEPRIITYRGSPATGLLGEIVAINGGRDDVFVDARNPDGPLPFAGEKETKVAPVCEQTDQDPPEATVECMSRAVKYADRDTWQSLFAPWRFSLVGDDAPPVFDPDYRLRPAIFERAWEHSRRMIMSDVYDTRINRVGRVERIYDGSPEDEVPSVDEVTVILDHVGLIEGEHRTFTNLKVRRVWRLQRLDDGPWKIADVQHL